MATKRMVASHTNETARYAIHLCRVTCVYISTKASKMSLILARIKRGRITRKNVMERSRNRVESFG
jgi:hypothetical protein